MVTAALPQLQLRIRRLLRGVYHQPIISIRMHVLLASVRIQPGTTVVRIPPEVISKSVMRGIFGILKRAVVCLGRRRYLLTLPGMVLI